MERLDLLNTISEVEALTVTEFDSRASEQTSGVYQTITADEHSERNQLEALRELLKERRELKRLNMIQPLYSELLADSASTKPLRTWITQGSAPEIKDGAYLR